jgi:cytochrome c
MKAFPILILSLFLAATGYAKADGDPKKGAQAFRACVACHALEPGLHLSGPSLGGFLERPAGAAEGYGRYSPELKSAGFEWSPSVLDAWVEAPEKMVPGTYMSFPGIPDPEVRADLVAFLMIAGAKDGAKRVVAENLIPASWTRSVAPDPIGEGSPENRVTSIRHCGDSYIIATEDGTSIPFWEKNVRLKVDSMETGPPEGTPVILGAGMRGDRVSVIFKSVADLSRLLVEECR